MLLPAAQTRQRSRASPLAPTLPVLTRVEQVRNLTAAAAQRGYPVHVRAVVTYFDPQEPDLFVQDSSAGIWVDLGKTTKLSLRAGQLVEIWGVSAADFAPQIGKVRIAVLGEAPLPHARPVSFERLASGAEDSQWVEIEGIVHRATTDKGHLRLAVATSGGRINVWVPDYHQPIPTQLIDAKVRLRGACGAVFNQKNQMTGVLLLVPSLAQVEIEGRAPQDAFRLPIQPVESLLRFTPKGASGHRVRVQGVVTFQAVGTSLFIKDQTQGIYIQTDERTAVEPGDLVDVVGFPSPGGYAPLLVDATFRRLGRGVEPVPATVAGDEAIQGLHDADLIRIEARLRGQVRRRGETDLILESGNAIFDAEAFDSKTGMEWPRLTNGSRLQLTGVCSVKLDESRAPRAFRLLLRSPKDVVVLERPSWWTLPRMAWGLGIMGALMLAVLGWVLVLRQQVTEQTRIILERLQHEVALEERYRDLFENATDVVYTHDLEGNMTSINRAGEHSTGYSRDEVLKMNIDRLVAPEYRGLVQRMTERKVETGETTTYELEIVHKSGRRVQLEVSTRLIHRGGKPFEVQGNARDIAERKRVEAELTKAKEAAEAATRAQRQFLANVSHEVRTPLNGILGMTELALETPLTAEQREYLEIVKTSGNSLLRVINDILDFSKAEARKLHLDALPFGLRENLEATLKPLVKLARQKGLELACHVPAELPPTLIGDPARLGQILANLTANAIKFTPRGEITLRVDTESRAQDKVCLHFAISDTGIGIAPEKQGLIFDAFAQADGSTTRQYGGSGLGLAICAQLVDLMGGRIWVESEPGRGSTFHFTARFGVEGGAARGLKQSAQTTELLRGDPVPQKAVVQEGNGALDHVAALARVEGDRGLLAELAALFVDDCPRMLVSIRQALECNDAEALARAAHAVKGSAGNFAAGKTVGAALKLEMMARGGDLTHAREAVAALEEALAQLTQALAGLAKEVTP